MGFCQQTDLIVVCHRVWWMSGWVHFIFTALQNCQQYHESNCELLKESESGKYVENNHKRTNQDFSFLYLHWQIFISLHAINKHEAWQQRKRSSFSFTRRPSMSAGGGGGCQISTSILFLCSLTHSSSTRGHTLAASEPLHTHLHPFPSVFVGMCVFPRIHVFVRWYTQLAPTVIYLWTSTSRNDLHSSWSLNTSQL